MQQTMQNELETNPLAKMAERGTEDIGCYYMAKALILSSVDRLGVYVNLQILTTKTSHVYKNF